jgi:transcriptional regulator with XRE-family HTH domain
MNKLQLTKEEFISANRSNIGIEICKFRLKKGYNQAVLAGLMGISRATISKIENGKFAISVDYLAKFSWYLDFDIKLLDKNQPEQ